MVFWMLFGVSPLRFEDEMPWRTAADGERRPKQLRSPATASARLDGLIDGFWMMVWWVLYIYLVGGWPTPLKVWVRQLGWWHSQYDGKHNPLMFQTTNQLWMVNTDGSFTGPHVTNVDQYEVIVHDDWMITGVPSIFWGHLHVCVSHLYLMDLNCGVNMQ